MTTPFLRTRQALATTAAALTAAVVCVSPAWSQNKMAPMPSKQTANKSAPVYICKPCKAYLSASAAKKMNYKDPMGHKLTKVAKIPAGYMDGSKMSGMSHKGGSHM